MVMSTRASLFPPAGWNPDAPHRTPQPIRRPGRRGTAGPRPRPVRPADHPALSASTGDISTLAKQGHFYFGLTDAADWQQRMDNWNIQI